MPDRWMKVLLIRHGESQGNRDRTMAGHGDDDLSDRGRIQVQTLRQWLQHQWPPSAIYSSPLRRAVATAHILAPAGVSLHQDPALAEGDLGILTGLTWEQAQARYPDLCQALMTTADWIPIPGAESPQAGRDRAQRLMTRLLREHGPGDGLWLISHQWILTHLVGALMGCDRTWQMAIPNTGLFEFWIDRDRWDQPGINRWTADLWQIKRFGTCPHL